MFLYHEIIFNDTPFPFQMSLLYLFSPPWLKHAFSLTFSTAVCFWWLPTSENNYSLGLFLSRFNGKMSFYQLLDIKNNSPQKMICSLRSVRIQLFLRRKTEDYLFDSPPLKKQQHHGYLLSFAFPLYCSKISPRKYVSAIHFILLTLMSLIGSKRTQHDLSVYLRIAEIMHNPHKLHSNHRNISWDLSLPIFSALLGSFREYW